VATLTVTDANGNPVAGDAPQLSSSDAGMHLGPVSPKGDGSYTATVTASTTAGTATLTATDGTATGTTPVDEYAPAAATAPACTDTWTGGAGDGTWSTAGNWSSGAAPGPTDIGCLPDTLPGQTAPSSYTVDVYGSVTAGTLVVGGTGSGTTQTLAVVGRDCPTTGQLTIAGGVVEPTGVVDLTSVSSCGPPAAVLAVSAPGTLTNRGTILADPGKGGNRYLAGTVVNRGTVTLGTGLTFEQSGAVFVNQGTVDTTGGLFDVAGPPSGGAPLAFVSDTGGTVTGTHGIEVGGGDTFVNGAGTVAAPGVFLDGGTGSSLDYDGTGASSVSFHNAVAVTGDIAAAQTLTALGASCPTNAWLEPVGDFTNAGTVVLSSDTTCGGPAAVLAMPAGTTMTNTGTLIAGAGGGGIRYLRADIVNTGQVDIQTETHIDQPGTTFDNQGTLDIGAYLDVPLDSGGSAKAVTFKATSGTMTISGSGSMFVDGGNAFVQGGTTLTAGSASPVLQGWRGGPAPTSLTFTGSGAMTLRVRDKITLSGDTSAGQAVVAEGQDCPDPAVVRAAGSFTNGGAIQLSSANPCGAPDSYLVVPPGATMTNAGVVVAAVGDGGTRHLEGNVVNTGTIVVKQPLELDQEGSTFDNQGTVALAGANLDIPYYAGGTGAPGTSTFTNDAGGLVAGTGTFTVGAGNTFVQGAGAVSTSNPVTLTGGSGIFAGLRFTGAGAGTFAARDLLSLAGDLAAGQSLQLQAKGCPDNAQADAAGSFTNAGTITMTSIDTCGGPADVLSLPRGATLTNTGTIVADPTNANGGTRYLRANVVNTGTVDIAETASFDQPGSVFDNQGTVDLTAQLSLPYNGAGAPSAITFDNAAGTVASSGGNIVFVDGGNAWVQGKGTITPAGTAMLVQGNNGQASTVSYTDGGPGSIAVRGPVNLSGNIATGQVLDVQGTGCPYSAVVTATGSFTNAGTIDLTNVSGCGNPDAALDLPTGATLTNAGTLEADQGQGGQRHVNGAVVNTGTIDVPANTALSFSGPLSTATGTVQTGPGSSIAIAAAPTDETPPTLSGTWDLTGNVSWPGASGFTTIAGTVVRAGGTIVDSAKNGADGLGAVSEVAKGATLGVQAAVADSAGVTVDGTVDLTNAGPTATPVVFTPASYTQTASGVLVATVGLLGTNTVAPAGAATLGGSLVVHTANGVHPKPGTRYQVIATSATPTGTFSSVSGISDPNVPDYAVTYEPTGVWLTALQPTTTTVTVSPSGATATYGDGLQLTATVASLTAPAGTAVFTDSLDGGTPTPLCAQPVGALSATASSASCSTATLPAGTNVIGVAFSDPTHHSGSSTGSLTETVGKVATTTTAGALAGIAPASTVEYGTPVTLRAATAPVT
ncbi:MAG TPA: invasin domain 3-containing protein, partial [Acidimicrobiales bacterium]|nr:invasin domain 3-containing protein [Acidimicrobiales bacterium]